MTYTHIRRQVPGRWYQPAAVTYLRVRWSSVVVEALPIKLAGVVALVDTTTLVSVCDLA